MADSLLSKYAQSLGVTEADANTARNIRLSVADCRHIKHVLEFAYYYNEHAEQWSKDLIEYLKGAV